MHDHLPDGCRRGDDLADTAVAALETDGWERGMALLERLLRDGPDAAPEAPAPLRELVAHVQHLPAWADQRRLDRGARAYYSAGFFWLNMALGPGALLRTYRNARVATVLAHTGDLTRAAYRRLADTAYWVGQATKPGGWEPGSAGLKATVGVRLLHARVRRRVLLSGGWDQQRLGVPISQYDMAHVALAFSRTSVDALQALGADFNARELDDIYHLWRCLSVQLGLEPGFQVDTHAQAGALRSQIEAYVGQVTREGHALAEAMIAVVSGFVQQQSGADVVLARNFTYALIQTFHGAEIADALGVPPTALARLLPLVKLAQTVRHRLDRLIDQRQGAVRRSLADQQELIEREFDKLPAYVPQPASEKIPSPPVENM